MERKLKHYMIHTPGDIYAGDFYGKNKKEAIENYKKWAKIDRMPKGCAIWEK
jgi:hypothetical protein